MLAGMRARPQSLRMDGAEQRSALRVDEGDVDFDQAGRVDDDAVQGSGFSDDGHELAFVP
jgi:hypothetical protein